MSVSLEIARGMGRENRIELHRQLGSFRWKELDWNTYEEDLPIICTTGTTNPRAGQEIIGFILPAGTFGQSHDVALYNRKYRNLSQLTGNFSDFRPTAKTPLINRLLYSLLKGEPTFGVATNRTIRGYTANWFGNTLYSFGEMQHVFVIDTAGSLSAYTTQAPTSFALLRVEQVSGKYELKEQVIQ